MTKASRGTRDQRGFTLVELMVVIAIIAVLTALVVGISGRTYGVNATTMSEQIAQTFQFARTRALSTRKIHRVEIFFGPPAELRVWQARKSGMSRSSIEDVDVGEEPLFVERTIIPNSVTLFHAVIGPKAAGAYTPYASTGQFDIDFLPNGAADVAGNAGSTDAATLYVTDSSDNRRMRVMVYSATGGSYVRKNW